jgi:hypothetical protein
MPHQRPAVQALQALVDAAHAAAQSTGQDETGDVADVRRLPRARRHPSGPLARSKEVL